MRIYVGNLPYSTTGPQRTGGGGGGGRDRGGDRDWR